MSRMLLTSLIASTLSLASAADVHLLKQAFAGPSGEIVIEVCYEHHDDHTIIGAYFEDYTALYYDGDNSGTIEGSKDRVADTIDGRTLVYYHDALLNQGTQQVLGPIYRSGTAHIESDADWQAHLIAIARFMSAATEYEVFHALFGSAQRSDLPACDEVDAFAPYNPF